MRIFSYLVLILTLAEGSSAKAFYEPAGYSYYCNNHESTDSSQYVGFHVEGLRLDRKSSVQVSVSSPYRRFDQWRATANIDIQPTALYIIITNDRLCRGQNCLEWMTLIREQKAGLTSVRGQLQLADGSQFLLGCDESLSILDLTLDL